MDSDIRFPEKIKDSDLLCAFYFVVWIIVMSFGTSILFFVNQILREMQRNSDKMMELICSILFDEIFESAFIKNEEGESKGMFVSGFYLSFFCLFFAFSLPIIVLYLILGD